MQFEGKESIKRVKPILRSGSIFQEGDFSAETCMLYRKRQCEMPPSGGEVSPSVDRNIPLVLASGFRSLGKQETGGRGSWPQDKPSGRFIDGGPFLRYYLSASCPAEMRAK